MLFRFVSEPEVVLSWDTARRLSLPIVLSAAFMPFIYAMALFVAYDGLFRLYGWRITDPRLRRYARFQTALKCHLRLRPLGALPRLVSQAKIDDRKAVDAMLARCRA